MQRLAIQATPALTATVDAVKISESWSRYATFSGKASDNARKLAFAGLAIVWVLSGGGVGNASTVQIEDELVFVSLCLVLALVFDFVQYGYLSWAWRHFAHAKEKALKADAEENGKGEAWRDVEFDAPDEIPVVAEVFYWCKQVAVAAGYVVLLAHMIDRLL